MQLDYMIIYVHDTLDNICICICKCIYDDMFYDIKSTYLENDYQSLKNLFATSMQDHSNDSEDEVNHRIATMSGS